MLPENCKMSLGKPEVFEWNFGLCNGLVVNKAEVSAEISESMVCDSSMHVTTNETELLVLIGLKQHSKKKCFQFQVFVQESKHGPWFVNCYKLL